ncbi:hypothetical protein ACFV3R_28115 [Streptomyces sp. NPDC059740]
MCFSSSAQGAAGPVVFDRSGRTLPARRLRAVTPVSTPVTAAA